MSDFADDERLGLPSASKMERVCNCGGSENLIRALPPPAPADPDAPKTEMDEWAESGTRIHRARETENTLALDPEEFTLYQDGLKYEAQLLDKWMETHAIEECEEGPRELRLYLHDQRTLKPIASGQLDVHYLSGEHALIADWKSGFCNRLVGATGNWQLRLAACLLKEDRPELKLIRVAFVKPRMDPTRLDFVDYGEWELQQSYNDTVYRLWWATQPDAQRVPGQHCYYCPAKSACREAAAYSLLPSVIAQWKRPIAETPEESVAQMTHEDMAFVWSMRAITKAILEAIDDRLRTLTPEELAKVGMRLPERGRAMDPITDIHNAFLTLRDTHGCPEDYLWDECLRMIKGPLFDFWMKKTGCDKTSAVKNIESIIMPFITRKNSRPALKLLKE